MIIAAEPEGSDMSIALWVGGFHTKMRFLGCTGHLMAGSGLQQELELVYVPSAVQHT